MNQDFAGLAPATSVGITNAGLSGNAQYKITWTGSNFVEPTAGFSFTRTMFGSGASLLDLQDSSTVRLQAGTRFGTTWDVGNNFSIGGSIKALVYSNVLAQGSSNGAPGEFAPVIAPTGQGLIRGELDPNLSFNLPHDYSVNLSGSVYFGQDLVGGAVALNLRKQF